MIRKLFPYGIWYALAGWSAGGALTDALAGSLVPAVASGVLGLAILAAIVPLQVRGTRSGQAALRAELERLVDERAPAGAVAWLNRDARMLFTAEHARTAGMRERVLMVMDEDLLDDRDRARDAGGGRVAATFTVFRAHPAVPRVMCRTDGMVALVTAADVEEADPGAREPRYRGWAGAVRALMSGMMFAGHAELSAVLAQFREAEPIHPDAKEAE